MLWGNVDVLLEAPVIMANLPSWTRGKLLVETIVLSEARFELIGFQVEASVLSPSLIY